MEEEKWAIRSKNEDMDMNLSLKEEIGIEHMIERHEDGSFKFDDSRMFPFWSKNEALELFKQELFDAEDEGHRLRAVRCLKNLGTYAGIDMVVECFYRIVESEISDNVLIVLPKLLPSKQYLEHPATMLCMCKLLANPEIKIRQNAVTAVLELVATGWAPIIKEVTLPEYFNRVRNNTTPSETHSENDSINETQKHIWLVQYLIDSERFPSFFQRISLCELLADSRPWGISKIDENEIILALAKDSAPMVRVALLENIGENFPSEHGRHIPMDIILELLRDPDPFVQETAAAKCIGRIMIDLLKSDPSSLVNILKDDFIMSENWRVRLSLAKKLDIVHAALHQNDTDMDTSGDQNASATPPNIYTQLVDTISRLVMTLMGDMEPMVRSAAASKLHWFVDDSSAGYIDVLADDQYDFVQKSLISNLHSLIDKRQNQVAQILSRLVTHYELADIQTFAVKTFFENSIFKAMNHETRMQLIKVIYDMCMNARDMTRQADSQNFPWRTIEEAVLGIPSTVQSMTAAEWETKLGGFRFYVVCLCDPVYQIRNAASSQIVCLSQTFGADWSTSKLSPLPRKIYENDGNNYRIRVQALVVASELLKMGPLSADNMEFINYAATSDPVANVRQKALTLFGSLLEKAPV